MNLRELIADLEKERFNLKFSLGWVFFIMSLRFFLEVFLMGAEIGRLAHFIHNISYFFFTLLLGILSLSLLAKEKPRRVFNIILLFYPLLLIPPLADYFILDKGGPYAYFQNSSIFFDNFLSLFFSLRESLRGFIVEGLLMCSLAAVYVLGKTRSLVRMAAAFLAVYLILSVTATPSLYIPLELRITHEGYSLLYLSLSVVIFFLLLRRATPKKAGALIKNFRGIKTGYYLLLVLAGSLLGGSGLNPIILLLSIFTVFFTRQFAIVINDLADVDIDKISNPERPLAKRTITKREFQDFGRLLLVIATIYALLIGNLVALILFFLSLVLIFLYSLPPLRFRQTIFSSAFIGLSSCLAVLFGYVSQGGESPLTGTGPLAGTSGTTIAAPVILLFLAVSLGGVIKDRKDYHGDKTTGVKTIYTVYGLEKGKRISLAFLAVAFLLPVVLLHNLQDMLFFSIATLIAVIDFWKNEHHERILLYAFLVIVYCSVRLKLG